VSALTNLSDKTIGNHTNDTTFFGFLPLIIFELAFFWLISFSESVVDPY
jgi:hypothetical protein